MTVFSKEGVIPCFFVTFNIIIRHNIFPDNFIEILQVAHKIWIFSSSILFIFIKFLIFFFTLSCSKSTNDVKIQQMMSAFFIFNPTINRLLTNYINLILHLFLLECEGDQIGLTPEKVTFKKPRLIRIAISWC